MMERGKQTRRVPYTVNKLNVIRSALAGYHGDVSIVREMAQNADDARSPWLEFRFFTDRLVVRNASVFTSKNFDAILSIASGSKRDEASMTGTWGTGFLAVYHLTDHPELHSAGEHIVFDPCLNELDATVSHVKDGTEFHLPWRTTRTEIAKEIEAEPWDAERIARLRAAVAVEIYRVLPFLRQLRRIAVYDGDAGEPAYSVARSMTAERVLDNGTRQERWEISGWDGQDERSYHWVVYRGELDRGFASNSSTAKTREIAFAVAPPTSWFGRSMPGLLYNFLPTPVETGFTFHIQGDFFPDANRQGILTDAGEKGDWNRKVIEGIAELFVANLETLREEAAQPRDFYQLLPVSCAAHCAFLSPITKTFRESATEFGLILCTDGRWTRPGDVRFAGEALRTIAQDYMPGIAPRSEPVGPLPTTVRAFVETLGGRRLDYADVLAYLRSVIPGGTRLEESDAILNSREKLDRLLGYIEGRIANTTGSARDSLIEALVDTPIVLDTDGNLQEYGSDGPYLASAMMRAILPEDFYWLVDAELEMQHRPVFAGLEPLNTDDVIRALTEIAPECSDKQMAQAHPAVGGWNKLTAILDYLVANQEHITADVSGLPICPDDDGVIHTIADAPWIADDEARELLAGAGVRFMARLALAETRHVEWLERAGVDRLTPSRMIDVLERITQVAGQRDGTTGWLKDRDRLRGIYRYFYRHENHLDVDDRRRLRALPFVLTQGGRLHAIDDATMPLTLPPESADEAVDIAHILNLDNLVSDDVLDLETRPFFEVTLGLRPLTRGDYIQRYVLEHYQAVVDHEARLALLDYVRCHSTLAYGQPGLLERMMKAPLVRCSDDVYRAASDVYFPSAALDAVFPLGYAAPHAMYDVQAETAVGSNTWADFFRLLHMREQPGADDIVRAVQRTLEEHSAPDVAAVAHMQTIYTLLNRRWDAYQAHSGILAPLQVLAWLPSQREDRWYRPDEVFSANLGPLIASQAPILRFVQARTEFAQFLGLNLSARMSDVVQHLLWLSRQKGGDPPANAIYTELGRASLHELAPLRGEPVIYDHAHTRYWRGDHVFIGSDAAVDFGRRRCYLAADDVRDWLALFTRLGAHTGSATEADYRAVLAEIADEAGCEPIDAADEYIVHRAYGALARMLDPSADEQPAWVAAMRSQRVVLCTDGRMRTPGEVFLDDRPGLLEHFRDDAVHLPKDIERRERSVLLAIGVRRLSDVVRRELDTITDPKTRDPDRTARLRILGTPLRRIVDTYAHESDTCWNDPEIFSAVAVYSAPEIYVRFVLEAGNVHYRSAAKAQDAFYSNDDRRIYVLRACSGSTVALATEIATVLHPGGEPARISPIISQILECPRQDIDAILDGYGFQKAVAVAIDRRPAVDIDAPPISIVRLPDNEQEPEDELIGESPRGVEGTPSAVLEPWPERTEPPLAGAADVEEPVDTTEPVDGSLPTRAEPQLPMGEVPGGPGGTSRQVTGVGGTPYRGPLEPVGPRLPTNWAALQRRYGEMQGYLEDAEVTAGIEDERVAPDDRPVDLARFVLSFGGRYGGYLRITRMARRLLDRQRDTITCTTDFEQEFPLYIDWEQGVLHNSDVLPTFFAAHDIPGGGIVYLERVHGSRFRLYYKSGSGVVKDVRIAENDENGRVQYHTIPEVSVGCEVDERVFRAEKRFEDLEALCEEARGKKSILETVIDVFEKAGPDAALTQDEVFRAVFETRMISPHSITWTLNDHPCFVRLADRRWGFERQRGIAARTPAGGTHAPAEPNGRDRDRDAQGHRPGPKPGESSPTQHSNAEEGPGSGQTEDEFVRVVERLIDCLRARVAQPDDLQRAVATIQAALKAFLPAESRESQPVRLVPSNGKAQEPEVVPDAILALLDGVRTSPWDSGIGNELRRQFADVAVASVTAGAGEAAFLATLAAAEPLVREKHLEPAMLAAIDDALHARRLDEATGLIELYIQGFGSVPAGRNERLVALREAWEFVGLADAASDAEERLGYLVEALASADDEEIRRLTAEAARRAAYNRLQAEETLRGEGRIIEAIAEFDACVGLFRAHRFRFSGVEEIERQFTLVRKRLIEAASAAAATKAGGAGAIDLYRAVARLFCEQPVGDRRVVAGTYFSALRALAREASEKENLFAAIVLLEQALEVAESRSGQATIWRGLAGLYEEVRAWERALQAWNALIMYIPDYQRSEPNMRRLEAQRRMREDYLASEVMRDAFRERFLKLAEGGEPAGLVTPELVQKLPALWKL